MHDLTFLIKTFQRRDCLARCLRSVFQFHPGAKVVIAEDSFTPYAEELVETDFPDEAIRVRVVPSDVGISAGRNAGLELIDTPYFISLDDDQALRPDSMFTEMYQAVQGGQWDLIAGTYVHYDAMDRPYTWSWEGRLVRVGTVLICQNIPPVDTLVPYDIVNNCFVARTEAVRRIGGWDPELMLLEHVDFFLRAKQAGIRVSHMPGALIDHRFVRSAEYRKSRFDREQQFRILWMKKHGLSHFITFEGRVHVVRELWPGNRGEVPPQGQITPSVIDKTMTLYYSDPPG